MYPSFATIVREIITLINAAITVATALVMVLFLYSGFNYIRAGGSGKDIEKSRSNLLWGVVALFIIFSIWGILRVVSITLLDTPIGSQQQFGL